MCGGGGGGGGCKDLTILVCLEQLSALLQLLLGRLQRLFQSPDLLLPLSEGLVEAVHLVPLFLQGDLLLSQ